MSDLIAGILTLIYVLLWSPETVAYPACNAAQQTCQHGGFQ